MRAATSLAPERHCAVVGAGPAGFYCAEALLEADPALQVCLVERLPAAFGLARYGVAPDHLKLKQVCAVFDRIARHPRLHLVGHVAVPETVPLGFLREHFDAVVLATGAPLARRLRIAGEHLTGSHSAAELVAWYNGHPQAADFVPDLSGRAAVVVGQGNVALDMARILLLPPARRQASDMATHALLALDDSGIRNVHIVGRRGLWQTRFSVKELREFEQIEGVSLHVHAPAADAASACAPAGLADEARQAGEFLQRHAVAGAAIRERGVHFHFGYEPVRLAGERAVQAAEFAPVAGVASEPLAFECGLFVASIGNHAEGMPGLGIDPARGSFANDGGQALDSEGRPVAGVFVTGWARRGAVGVIGTNRDDAGEVAGQVLAYLRTQSADAARAGFAALRECLAGQRRATIDQAGWARIDAAERAAGVLAGRPRVKLVRTGDLLAAAAPG
jgi:ferredoxin--NADP+ reductase